MGFINKIIRLFKKNRIVVYTAIFGDYDDLKNQEVKIEGVDFYCFTDNKNLKSDLFKIILIKPEYDDNTRNAKIFKILPHNFFPQHEYSLWIDGSVIIKDLNLKEFINRYLVNNNIALFKHPDRDCIYDEVNACIDAKKDDPDIMLEQVNNYRLEGYPVHNGLAACAIIARRHNNKDIIKLDEDWWVEIKKYSKRDQLSFNYVAWKNKVSYSVIEGILWDNAYFKVIGHLK